jgi:hypothetical protein
MEKLRNEIMAVIEENWPISVTEIARKMGIFKKGMDERKRKASIGKIGYHVKKLKEDERLMTKKIGQTLIIWPTDIEKLRVLHEMMR